jgi:hypothetical protein
MLSQTSQSFVVSGCPSAEKPFLAERSFHQGSSSGDDHHQDRFDIVQAGGCRNRCDEMADFSRALAMLHAHEYGRENAAELLGCRKEN